MSDELQFVYNLQIDIKEFDTVLFTVNTGPTVETIEHRRISFFREWGDFVEYRF